MPARWNDKTIVLFDTFMSNLHTGKIYGNNTFQLYSLDGTTTECKGLWLCVDNGYLRWPCTIPPFKDNAEYRRQIRWSKWYLALLYLQYFLNSILAFYSNDLLGWKACERMSNVHSASLKVLQYNRLFNILVSRFSY